jgi:hypothetical protein
VWIIYQVLWVTWNVYPVDLIKLFDQIVIFLFEIYWDNSCSSTFQKLYMRILDICLLVEKFFPWLSSWSSSIYGIPDPIVLILPLRHLFGNWLGEDSNDRSLCFGTNMVTGSNHWRRGHDNVLALRILPICLTIKLRMKNRDAPLMLELIRFKGLQSLMHGLQDSVNLLRERLLRFYFWT